MSLVAVVRFGEFQADLRLREIRKRGLRIRLQDQPFQVLAILLEHAGEPVAREELRQRLWPADTFVDFDHGLNNAITRLREALCDSAERPIFIETLPRRGYRFIAPVTADRAVVMDGPGVSSGALQPASASSPPTRETPDDDRVRPDPQTKRTQAAVAIPAGELRVSPIRVRLVLAAIALLLTAVAIASFTGHRAFIAASRGIPLIRSLAVLPLENLSGDQEQEYFVDGITDQLITDLARISSLRVISRSSTMHYKGTRIVLPQIARELNVDAVVEGTVQRSGGRVRVTAQLVRAAPEQHLWAQSYERNLQDVLSLQEEVARSIAEEIQIKLSPQERTLLKQARPVNPETYELYLKGAHFANKKTEEGLRKGRDYYQQAVDKDPNYVLAYAGLANAYDLLGSFSILPARDAFPKAEAAAMKALAIDNSLADAHATLGIAILYFDWKWPAAAAELRRATELNPSSAMAHEYYATYFDAVGRVTEAIAQMERARELDPLSLEINSQLGRTYHDGRYYDRAIEQCRKTVELDQNFSPGHWCLGLGYARKKMYKEAIDEFLRARQVGGCPCELPALGYTYAAAGDRISARKILQELEKRSEQGYQLSYLISEVYAGLGEADRAFAWLDRAYRERDGQLTWLKVDPMIDNLRADSRFKDLLRLMDLPQ